MKQRSRRFFPLPATASHSSRGAPAEQPPTPSLYWVVIVGRSGFCLLPITIILTSWSANASTPSSSFQFGTKWIVAGPFVKYVWDQDLLYIWILFLFISMVIGWRGPCKCVFKQSLFPEGWYIFNLFLNFLEHSIFNVILGQLSSSLECCFSPVAWFSLIPYSMGSSMFFPICLQIPGKFIDSWAFLALSSSSSFVNTLGLTSHLLELFSLLNSIAQLLFCGSLPSNCPTTFPTGIFFFLWSICMKIWGDGEWGVI